MLNYCHADCRSAPPPPTWNSLSRINVPRPGSAKRRRWLRPRRPRSKLVIAVGVLAPLGEGTVPGGHEVLADGRLVIWVG